MAVLDQCGHLGRLSRRVMSELSCDLLDCGTLSFLLSCPGIYFSSHRTLILGLNQAQFLSSGSSHIGG